MKSTVQSRKAKSNVSMELRGITMFVSTRNYRVLKKIHLLNPLHLTPGIYQTYFLYVKYWESGNGEVLYKSVLSCAGDDLFFEPFADHLFMKHTLVNLCLQVRHERVHYVFTLNILARSKIGVALTRRPYPRLHVARHRRTNMHAMTRVHGTHRIENTLQFSPVFACIKKHHFSCAFNYEAHGTSPRTFVERSFAHTL